jgi:hypothetical protein
MADRVRCLLITPDADLLTIQRIRILDHGTERHYFYLARAQTWSASPGDRTGPEFTDPARGDLQHLGIVSRGPEVQVAGGSAASAGDVIIARTNDHRVRVANSDVLRVEAVNDDGTITMRRRLDRDGETGKVAWAGETFRYGGYATADLAYGATVHTKQGKTVTVAIALLTGSETAGGGTPR